MLATTRVSGNASSSEKSKTTGNYSPTGGSETTRTSSSKNSHLDEWHDSTQYSSSGSSSTLKFTDVRDYQIRQTTDGAPSGRKSRHYSSSTGTTIDVDEDLFPSGGSGNTTKTAQLAGTEDAKPLPFAPAAPSLTVEMTFGAFEGIGEELARRDYEAIINRPVVVEEDPELLSKSLDQLQIGLDGAGLTPGAGIVPDVINTIISLGRGNFGDAGLNALAAIPFFGIFSKGGEVSAKILKAADKGGDFGEAAADAAKFAKSKAAVEVVDGVANVKPPRLPGNARALTGKSGVQEVFRRLQQNHGINPKLASKRLHEFKANLGYPPDADLLFDLTGNVFDPKTLEWLGSLTEGGAKAGF